MNAATVEALLYNNIVNELVVKSALNCVLNSSTCTINELDRKMSLNYIANCEDLLSSTTFFSMNSQIQLRGLPTKQGGKYLWRKWKAIQREILNVYLPIWDSLVGINSYGAKLNQFKRNLWVERHSNVENFVIDFTVLEFLEWTPPLLAVFQLFGEDVANLNGML
jgi:hypothetical protein